MAVQRAMAVLMIAVLVAVGGADITEASAQEAGSLRGRVTEATTLRPVVGAQVSIMGTGRGSLTNARGEFVILNVPAGEQSVRVQMLGYGTAEQSVAIAAGQATSVEFQLEQEALALDEVVVTGTAGQARRREVGNSIAQIDLSEVPEPAPTVESLLQGRSAGVNVTMGSATMGAGPAIRLRGNVSVSQGNQPLIYVDGVRQTADAYPRNVSAGGKSYRGNNAQSSPLSDINPNDIERIEILKGAAAATLYGTEAAAGVIQIFTKRGVAGEPAWSYQTDQSLNWIRPYGSDQRPLVGMEPWLKTAYGQKHNLSVRGGTEGAQYFLSTAFEDGEGVLPGDEQTRYSLRGNLTFKPSETLTLDWNSLFTNHDFSTAPVGNNDEGIFFNVYRAPNGFVQLDEIDQLLVVQTRNVNDRMVFGTTARWVPLPTFSNRLTLGLDRAGSHNTQFRPFGYLLEPRGDVTDIRWESQTVTVDYVGSLDLALAESFRTTLSLGGQLARSSQQKLDGYGIGLPGPGEHTLSSAAQRTVFEEEIHVNTGGLFVQGLFNLKDRYFITTGLRVDGNSAFGQDFGLQPYPKVSFSYVISDESFWRDAWGTMKLRGAYGWAGRAPGAFDAVRTWEALSFVGQTGFLPLNLGNPNLGPERTAELELGFDGSFVNDRLTLAFTYYDQKTTDALFPVFQSPSQGFLSSQLENVGELTNRGLELTANATVVQRPSVIWDLGATLATNHSEILEIGGSSSYNLVEGHPAPVVRGIRVLNADEFADPEIERDAFFGPNQPTHIIGVNTSLSLANGIVLTARGDYQGGHYLTDFPSTLVARDGPGAVGCDDVYEIVPWDEYDGYGDTHPNLGQVRALDRARCYHNVLGPEWTFRGDFFKLREVTARVPVPFTIPRISDASVTVSARNLWRWVNSEFPSFDPEIISARDQVNALTFGITDQLPPPASLILSVQVGF